MMISNHLNLKIANILTDYETPFKPLSTCQALTHLSTDLLYNDRTVGPGQMTNDKKNDKPMGE